MPHRGLIAPRDVIAAFFSVERHVVLRVFYAQPCRPRHLCMCFYVSVYVFLCVCVCAFIYVMCVYVCVCIFFVCLRERVHVKTFTGESCMKTFLSFSRAKAACWRSSKQMYAHPLGGTSCVQCETTNEK